MAAPLVAAAAGFLVVSGVASAHGTDLRAERRTQLTDLVTARGQEVAAAQAQVQRDRAEVDALIAQQEAGRTAGDGRSDAVGAAAGLTPVSGRGLSVTLDDAPASARNDLADGVTPDDLVVHQQDVQAVVNALWSAGATGMRIMDQRVVSTSAVRCVGNTLVLQGRVYAPPFRISAVGDPAALRAALDASPQVRAYRSWVDAVGLGYSVDDEGALSLPAYDGSITLRYARSAS